MHISVQHNNAFVILGVEMESLCHRFSCTTDKGFTQLYNRINMFGCVRKRYFATLFLLVNRTFMSYTISSVYVGAVIAQGQNQ